MFYTDIALLGRNGLAESSNRDMATQAFPKVYFDVEGGQPPRIVRTPEEESRLDPLRWLASPTQVAPTLPDWPQLFYNVNLPPRTVFNSQQAEEIGSDWRPMDLRAFQPAVPGVSLTPESATATAAGGDGSFDVTITGAGASGTWTVDKDASADWLTLISPLTPQSVDGTVNYTAAANSGPQRSANFYVNGKTFTVTQDAGA